MLRGLNVHMLDAWRRASQYGPEAGIVSVEIVAKRVANRASDGRFRVILAQGISIEVEAGFGVAELRRLVAA